MKVGRNDPCPCGSGKKYKKCCLGKSERKDSPTPAPGRPPVHSIESERHNRLVNRLMAFLESPANAVEVKKAAEEFFLKSDYSEWEIEYGQQIFHAWLLFFRKDRKGTTLSQRYLEKHMRSLSPEERRILEHISDEPFRLVEVQKIRLDEGLTVKDLHSGESINIKERTATHQLTRWDLLLIHLRRLSTHNEFNIIIPVNRALREWMLDAAQWLLDERRKHYLEADIFEVMTIDLKFIFDALVDSQREAMKPPKMTTSDGEDLIFCKARYRIEDESAVRDALKRHRSFEAMEDEDGFRWQSGYRKKTMHGMPGYISFGRVRFENGNLILETNSRERLKKGKALLKKNAGRFLKHLADSVQDVEQAISESMPGSADMESSIPPEIERQIIAQAQEQYYLEQWPVAPIPALDGMTPMEASRYKTTRPMLIELLKDIEYGMEKNPKMAFDISKLWKKLGLKRQ